MEAGWVTDKGNYDPAKPAGNFVADSPKNTLKTTDVLETLAQMFNLGPIHYADAISEGVHLSGGACAEQACQAAIGDGHIKVGKYLQRALAWLDRPASARSLVYAVGQRLGQRSLRQRFRKHWSGPVRV